MKYASLALVALLAGCGNAKDDPRAARDLAAAVSAEAATPATKPATTPVARRAATPAADAFNSQVRAVIAIQAEGAEPVALGSAPASAPEDSEPASL
jgi:hypothetical protein